MQIKLLLKIAFLIFAVIIAQSIMSVAYAVPNYQYNMTSEQNGNPNINQDNIQYVVNIPKNQQFEAILQTSINSNEIRNGDIVSAIVRDDWVYDGVVVAPAGSVIYGNVVKFKRSGGFWRNGKFTIQFNEIVTPNGILYITTDEITIKQGRMRWLKVFAKFVSGAILGALATTGPAIAAIPVAAFTGLVNASEEGTQTVLPSGSIINLRLKKRVQAAGYEY